MESGKTASHPSCDSLLHAMEHGGDVCLGVLAAPLQSGQHVDVDPCWKGPHITLAGFRHYDQVPGGSHVDMHGETHYHIGRHLDQAAQVRPHGSEWHVTHHNGSMKPHHLAVHSRTLHDVVQGLAKFGFSDLKPSPGQTTGFHVTFDRNTCPRGGACEASALREFATEGWRLFPVVLDHCSRIDKKTQCPRADLLHYCHDHVSHTLHS